MSPDRKWLAYAFGIGTAVAATVVRLLLDPWLADRVPYLTYFAAMIVAAWYAERRGAIASIVAGALLCAYFVLEPRGSFGGGRPEYQLALVLYLGVGAFTTVSVGALRGAERKAAAALAEAKESQERLRENEALLRVTLSSIGDAVIATDEDGRVTFLNPCAAELTGWTTDDATGRPLGEVFDIFDEVTRDKCEDPVARVLREGKVVGLANHTSLRKKGGATEYVIEDSAAPIRGADGTIRGVVLVFRDATGRKQEETRRAYLAEATATLADSLDYQLTIAKVAQLAVPRLADWCAVDLLVDGHATPQRLAVAHADPAKVELARELHAKYPPKPDAATGLPNVLRTGRSELYAHISDEMLVAGCEDEEHLRIARELRLHSAMVVPLAARGRVLGAMSFVHAESGRTYTQQDVELAEELARRCATVIENAHLYALEQKARRSADLANRAKDEFLAVVSHELRTPLSAIMGWAKMLARPDFDEQRRPRAVETIERNAVAMAQLVEDLLDMSRVISGKLRLEVQPVDVVHVIEAAIDSIRPAAVARAVEIATVFDGASPLMGDPTRLQQIVWNLLSNAVKFSSKGGRVTVSVRRVGSSVEIRVADGGKGISPAFLPTVFDAFRQEDGTPSRAHGGLGLGLAITRQLVELHGGRIAADSDGEGRGATFTITLPISSVAPARKLREEPASPSISEVPIERPAHLRGLRVLVVDDDEDGRRLIAAILEDCGCRVTTAGSAAAATRHFEKDIPDVLVSDIGMPDEDGYSLITRIRALSRDRGGDIPAVALTAYARAEDRRRMLSAGYSTHVPKPVEPAELVATVATLSRFTRRADRAHS